MLEDSRRGAAAYSYTRGDRPRGSPVRAVLPRASLVVLLPLLGILALEGCGVGPVDGLNPSACELRVRGQAVDISEVPRATTYPVEILNAGPSTCRLALARRDECQGLDLSSVASPTEIPPGAALAIIFHGAEYSSCLPNCSCRIDLFEAESDQPFDTLHIVASERPNTTNPSQIRFGGVGKSCEVQSSFAIRNNTQFPRTLELVATPDSTAFDIHGDLMLSAGGTHLLAARASMDFTVRYRPVESTTDDFGILQLQSSRPGTAVRDHSVGFRGFQDDRVSCRE